MSHKATDFLDVVTVHRAELAWFWSQDKLHDDDYQIMVNDSVNAKIKELEKTYAVRNDTSYCCQFEGILLTGSDRTVVEIAGLELSRLLARFKHVIPLGRS